MKRYLITFLYSWLLFLISHSLSANGTLFGCSVVATEFPAIAMEIAMERCREYIVDRLPASSGPETIKATACPMETADPEDKTVFIFTNSPNWPVWLCQDRKKQEDTQQPEAPTLTITIADEKTGASGHEIPSVSGGGYGDDFFDDRRPRKPGMPGVPPFILETLSSGLLPAGLMPFAFGLELPELSDHVPVLFQQSVMSDDSDILVVISGTRQRIYRKRYELGDWYLAGQTDSKALSDTEEPFDDFIAEDETVRALVGAFGWAEKGSIPIYQMPIGQKTGEKGTMPGGNESASGSGPSGSRYSRGDFPESSQRQHQGQGSGDGGSGGGERNPSRSGEEFMEVEVSEADIILGAIRLIENSLSDDWFDLGVALEVPLTSLRTVLDVRSSRRIEKMLTLAKAHQVLNFEHFLFAIRMLPNYIFFKNFLQYLHDNHFIDTKTHQRLDNLREAPLPYIYEDGAFTGLAILAYAQRYSHDMRIYDGSVERESGDFPKYKKRNKAILYLLSLREKGKLSQARLFNEAPHGAARRKIADYFDSPVYRKVTDRPVPLTLEAEAEAEEARALPTGRSATEADILLSDRYSQMIEKSRWNDRHIQNLHLGLGLPVQALAQLQEVRSSKWLSHVLKTASEQGRLSFDNMVLALRAASNRRLASELIEQLFLEKHIDAGKKEYLRTLTPDQQPWIVNGQLTNYFLLAVEEEIGGRESCFFLQVFGDTRTKNFYEGCVRLSQNGQLSVNTGLEPIKKAFKSNSIRNLRFHRYIEERTTREMAQAAQAAPATMQTTRSTDSDTDDIEATWESDENI